MKRPVRITVVIAALALAAGGFALTSSAWGDTDNDLGGAKHPMNTNPAKTPNLDPPSPEDKAAPMEERIKFAKESVLAAADDPFTILCLNKDSTLAGSILVDAPSGAKPASVTEKQKGCDAAFPGSKLPPDDFTKGFVGNGVDSDHN